MSLLTSPRVQRWLVPTAAAACVLAGGAAIGVVTAAADHSLPPRSPQQLLSDLQTAKIDGLSGTIVARVDLGLPALPAAEGLDLSTLLSGNHTVRVWYSGPDRARVALLGPRGETDVISNGTDQWIWSSREGKAVHHKSAPKEAAPKDSPTRSPLPPAAPDQLARLALTALGQSTDITSSGPITVAGRDAYELVLAPKDPTARIGSIRVAIDADVHLPLRLQVFARNARTAAVEVGFTQVTMARPDAAEFVFNPPPGTTIVEAPASAPHAIPAPDKALMPMTPGMTDGRFAVVGSGWASVLVFRLPDEAGKDELTKFFAGLPEASGTWGHGHVLTGALFTVLRTDDGRLLIGAVGPDQVVAAAADPKAALSN